ncbi:MAG: hypothetical protein JJU29_19055, partial [Verrucomicrobia bacterium]|nr:hypothetical protein [Verrucomicrobiota bacterium]
MNAPKDDPFENDPSEFDFLKELPAKQVEPRDDFTLGVLRQVHRIRHRRQTAKLMAIHFVLAMIVGGGLLTRSRIQQDRLPFSVHRGSEATMASAIAGTGWLVAHQEANGAWAPEAWGGHARFSSGVTALATLALLHAPDGNTGDAIPKATEYLRSQLASHAPFHREGPELYNHLLTLKALLEIQNRYPHPDLAAELRATLAHTIRQQHSEGGWGYTLDTPMGYGMDSRTRANSAVTWWICDLLHDARNLGVPGAARARERGQQWLAQCFSPEHGPAYHPGSPPASPESALYLVAPQWSGAHLNEVRPAARPAADR